MTQQLNGTGGQTFVLGSNLTGNHNVGVRGSVIATMEAFNTEFLASKATSGYQKLPSGLIIQWGSATTSAGNTTTVFPIAFPSGVSRITISEANAAGWSVSNLSVYGVHGQSSSQFSVKSFAWTGGAFSASVGVFNWLAIGY